MSHQRVARPAEMRDDTIGVIDSGCCERNDRYACGNGESREPKAVTPQTPILVALALEDLTSTAWIANDEFTAAESAKRVPRAPVGTTESHEDIAQSRNPKEPAIRESDR